MSQTSAMVSVNERGGLGQNCLPVAEKSAKMCVSVMLPFGVYNAT